MLTLPPSSPLLSLRTSCWSWNQIRSWESPPNCCWPAGMRVWEAKHSWSHTVLPSTQIPSLPSSSSVSTNIGSKWPQNGDYCLADANFIKVQHARFCHAAQLQGCHFKIMTGVTFGRLLCQSVFHSLLLHRFQRNATDRVVHITMNTLWHIQKNINKRTNSIFVQAHLFFTAFGWLVTTPVPLLIRSSAASYSPFTWPKWPTERPPFFPLSTRAAHWPWSSSPGDGG